MIARNEELWLAREVEIIHENFATASAGYILKLLSLPVEQGGGGGPARTRSAVMGKIYRMRRDRLLPPADPANSGRRGYDKQNLRPVVFAGPKPPKPLRPKRTYPAAPKPPPAMPVGDPLPFTWGAGLKSPDPYGCKALDGEPIERNWCNRRVDVHSAYCAFHRGLFYQARPVLSAAQLKQKVSFIPRAKY